MLSSVTKKLSPNISPREPLPYTFPAIFGLNVYVDIVLSMVFVVLFRDMISAIFALVLVNDDDILLTFVVVCAVLMIYLKLYYL